MPLGRRPQPYASPPPLSSAGASHSSSDSSRLLSMQLSWWMLFPRTVIDAAADIGERRCSDRFAAAASATTGSASAVDCGAAPSAAAVTRRYSCIGPWVLCNSESRHSIRWSLPWNSHRRQSAPDSA